MSEQKLDREEKDFLDGYERGEWQSISDLKTEINRYQESARATFRKDRRVNIRLSSKDLEALQWNDPKIRGIRFYVHKLISSHG